jgi:protein-disulfide isomerase
MIDAAGSLSGRFVDSLSSAFPQLRTAIMLIRRTIFLTAAITALAAIAPSAKADLEGFPSPPQSFLSGQAADGPVKPEELAQGGPLGDTVIGKPGAPVTIIEYASLGCPICNVFHKEVLPKLKKAYIDSGKVVFIYREFPIGKSSQAAAAAARCVPAKDYFRISEKLMANQGKWAAQEIQADALYKLVQDTGVKRDAFDSCLANQPINDGLMWVKQRGRKLGVQGTPTFFINGQKIRGVLNFEEMQKLIEQHLASAKPA